MGGNESESATNGSSAKDALRNRLIFGPSSLPKARQTPHVSSTVGAVRSGGARVRNPYAALHVAAGADVGKGRGYECPVDRGAAKPSRFECLYRQNGAYALAINQGGVIAVSIPSNKAALDSSSSMMLDR